MPRLRVLIVPLSVLLLAVSIYALLILFRAEPGLYVELRLISVWDETLLMERRDVLWCLHIEAVAPPREGRDFVELLSGCYKGMGAAYVSHEKLRRVAEGWVEEMRSRGSDPEAFWTAFIVRAYVVNGAGRLLYSGMNTFSYKPCDMLEPRALKLIVTLIKGHHAAQIESEPAHLRPRLAKRVSFP